MNKLRYISIGLALILMGCGSNNSTNGDTKADKTTQKVSVPQKVDMEFPKALQTTEKKNNNSLRKNEKIPNNDEVIAEDELIRNQETQLNKSRGYTQLKDSINGVEETKKELEVNLLLADKLMPKIQEKCENTPIETTCTIEAGELSILIDKPLMREISNILGEEIFEEPNGQEPPQIEEKLGKTTFTQYKDDKDYQYALVMDMTDMEDDVNSKVQRSIQTIKWSKDENHIWSIYDYKNKESSDIISLRYNKKENGETEMEIKDRYSSIMTTSSASASTTTLENGESQVAQYESFTQNIEGEFYLKLTNLDEKYKISSNTKDKFDEDETSTTSSLGEIDKNGGYLKFRGIFLDTEYREKDTFDANGESLSSIYCDDSQACSLDDESTWLKSENYKEPEFPQDPDEEIAPPELIELTVTGGELKNDVRYMLLAPKSSIEGKSAKNILDMSIGDIFVNDKGTPFGLLLDKKYIDSLDELVIVEVNYGKEDTPYDENEEQNPPSMTESQFLQGLTFKVLPKSSRPTLSKY